MEIMQNVSRTAWESFIRCKRCFYLERKLKIRPIGMAGYPINSRVDALLKNEFDIYRKKQEPHPIFSKYKLNFVPYKMDEQKLKDFRNNFKGVRAKSTKTNFVIYGSIDDIWLNKDTDEAVDDILSITTTYDGKAKMLIKEDASLDELITLDMITWVRDNFVIESMVDGVPRGLMSERLVNVNKTIVNSENSADKLGVIQNEMLYNHYEPKVITSGGPSLTINGIEAQWENWEFESVGPTSSLLGSFSDKSDKRLWIGQWMHVTFPNSTHTLGNHTMTFEWPDEDFKGKETNFHVSLGYGEVFTNINVEGNDYHSDGSPSDWFSFNTINNNTVGTFTADFTQGFPDYGGLDWSEAVDYASGLTYEGSSGHLATITTEEEADLVYSILDGHSYWLGGFHNLNSQDYSEPSGGWEWITGETFNHDIWGDGEPNEVGPEDCLEVWGFDKFVNDNRCHMGWMGFVVEYEMNGTNHYEAYIPQWEWDEANETDIMTYVLATPMTDKERNDILKEQGDPDADNDGIVDEFDEDDDNDGIVDENDMDDDNDGIDDISDGCPGTPAGESVDSEGCSASQILKEIGGGDDDSLPSLSFILASISIGLLAVVRKPRK